jgi:tetratricopeptide (TPR) repeat protein
MTEGCPSTLSLCIRQRTVEERPNTDLYYIELKGLEGLDHLSVSMSLLLLLCTLLLLSGDVACADLLSSDKALELGQEQFHGQPVVSQTHAKKLTPQQERSMLALSYKCLRFLLDYRAALPLTQRLLALAVRFKGPRSEVHAVAPRALCLDYLGLRAFSEASAVITESASIMEELGLQQQEEYGLVLTTLGDVKRQLGRHREALIVYSKAKVVLDQFKARRSYGILLNNMAVCFDGLHLWNEALAFCFESIEHARTLVGDTHPEYAARVRNLGELYAKLGEFGNAVPRFKEALAVFNSVLGEGHGRTIATAARLADVRADITGEVMAVSDSDGFVDRWLSQRSRGDN